MTEQDSLAPATLEKHSAALPERRIFIDQCRGYAIFGMVLVNFLGLFDCMPWMLKHHREGFSYADHIAPLFMFIVGMGFHVSFQKTAAQSGLRAARRRALRRYGILIGMGLLYGGFSLRVGVWDALTDIGAAGLIALPAMHLGAAPRAATAAVSLMAYQGAFSCTDYGRWTVDNSINGGPLGPLSWVFILLMGTLAADATERLRGNAPAVAYGLSALLFSAAGWITRLPLLGWKEAWPFSQFAMSMPYVLYATGLCFLTLTVFWVMNEKLRIQLPHASALGKNPLILYLLQAALVLVARTTINPATSMEKTLLLFAFFYAVIYGVARHLDRTNRVLRI